MGGARGCLWETVYGVHTQLRSSEDVKHNLGYNVKTKGKRGRRFPGTLCEEQKEGQVKRVNRRIATSQGPIVFYIMTICVHQIDTDKEGSRWQGVGASI